MDKLETSQNQDHEIKKGTLKMEDENMSEKDEEQFEFAISLLASGKYSEAIAACDEINLQEDEFSPNILELKAAALLSLNQTDDAIQKCNELIQFGYATSYIQTIKAICLYDKHKYKKSLNLCNKILSEEPEYTLAINAKFKALFGLGRHSEVVDWCNRSLSIDKKNLEALQYKAASLMVLDFDNESLAACDEYILIESDIPQAEINIPLLIVKAKVLCNLRREDESLIVLDQILTHDPSVEVAIRLKNFILQEAN